MPSRRSSSTPKPPPIPNVRVETVKSGKRCILHPMSVTFPEGKVTAILGPEKSGKTTLLNFTTGQFVVEGLARGQVNLVGTKAFLSSQPTLHPHYTVLSHMEHYARLTSGTLTLSPAQTDRIEALLTTLSLYDHRSTPVPKLSPAHLTTLLVALETLSSPDTLFLQNPHLSLPLLQFLQKHVKNGPRRRVVLTLSLPPNSFHFRFLDHVVLLSRGHLTFTGPRKRTETFFAANGFRTPSETNPADHYVATVEGLHDRTLKDWVDNFTDSRGSELSCEKRLSEVQSTRRPPGRYLGREMSVNQIVLVSTEGDMGGWRKNRWGGGVGVELLRRSLTGLLGVSYRVSSCREF